MPKKEGKTPGIVRPRSLNRKSMATAEPDRRFPSYRSLCDWTNFEISTALAQHRLAKIPNPIGSI